MLLYCKHKLPNLRWVSHIAVIAKLLEKDKYIKILWK